MSYTNFQVGEKFPLPIKQQGEGGLFQVDVNGAMFILQLIKSDVVAVEAFRTGEMELALYEDAGVLFLLYQVLGIFKEGWGDAPLSFGGLSKEQMPSEQSLAAETMHLYLVDARLSLLLAQREEKMPASFAALLRRHAENDLHAMYNRCEGCFLPLAWTPPPQINRMLDALRSGEFSSVGEYMLKNEPGTGRRIAA